MQCNKNWQLNHKADSEIAKSLMSERKLFNTRHYKGKIPSLPNYTSFERVFVLKFLFSFFCFIWYLILWKWWIMSVFIVSIVCISSKKSFVFHSKSIYGFPPLKWLKGSRKDICLAFNGYPKCFSNSTPSETSLPFSTLLNYSSGMKLGLSALQSGSILPSWGDREILPVGLHYGV